MALERLAKSRDESYLGKPILAGNLVMHAPLNRKSKPHPSWNGPVVVLDSTEKDIYQLATPNGHIIVNVKRICKSNADKRDQYTGDFWDPSYQLKLRHECTRNQNLSKSNHSAEITKQKRLDPVPAVSTSDAYRRTAKFTTLTPAKQ